MVHIEKNVNLPLYYIILIIFSICISFKYYLPIQIWHDFLYTIKASLYLLDSVFVTYYTFLLFHAKGIETSELQ